MLLFSGNICCLRLQCSEAIAPCTAFTLVDNRNQHRLTASRNDESLSAIDRRAFVVSLLSGSSRRQTDIRCLVEDLFEMTLSLKPCVAVALALIVIGCDIPSRPPLKPVTPEQDDATQAELDDVIVESPGASFPGNWETWEAYFVRGKHVGYSHIVAEKTRRNALDMKLPDVRYQVDNYLKIHRGPTTLIQRLNQVSTETDAGQLIEYQTNLLIGPLRTRHTGSVADGKLSVETVRGKERTSATLDWLPENRGLLAVEQSLRRKPIGLGDRRTLKMLVPVENLVATVSMQCDIEASVPMMNGKSEKLLEIHCESVADESINRWVIWANAEGSIRRTYWPGYDMITFRTDQSSATEGLNRPEDQVRLVSFAVEGDLDKHENAKRVAYQLTPTKSNLRSPEPFELGPAPQQYIRRRDDGSLQVLVSRREETVGKGFETVDLPPTGADRKASALVDSGAPMIRRIVTAAIRSNSTMSDKDVAVELAATAHSLISTKDHFEGVSRASDVANLAEGDCVEQAILLAALLRARQIPARIAVGLAYRPGDDEGQDASMEFHAWTLAHAGDQWLALDATTGKPAAAGRLTFTTSDLSDRDEVALFQTTIDAVGKFELKVLGAQY